jgi:biotin synthase
VLYGKVIPLNVRTLLNKLSKENRLAPEEYLYILDNAEKPDIDHLFFLARQARDKVYGPNVFMRGLVEFSNYCQQDCMYCGIRMSNDDADRYRLDIDSIISCCKTGRLLGYKTFVLQGGEDPSITDDWLLDLVKSIKFEIPDCAITLSVGERPYESYKALYEAGADRYLLRHETANEALYNKLHPNMTFKNRMECLNSLKEIGFQVGAGFMTGLPGQVNKDYVKDLMFLEQFNPHMVGIGPFIPHGDTPLKNALSKGIDITLVLVALTRLILPDALIPATTALGSADPKGREKGLLAGANVVMPNITPTENKEKYLLYEGKICTGDEASHCRGCIQRRIESTGMKVDMSIGHHKTVL